MKNKPPSYEEFKKLIGDDYSKKEDMEREDRYWKNRIKNELERREAKEGSWWKRLIWNFKNPIV